jgi:DNA-binding NtrC family response regulator
VRVVCATNIDLQSRVSTGEFREDLYYRLAVVPIRLPPLRDRKEDIPLLVEHFIVRFNARLNARVSRVAEPLMAQLCNAAWPGNIRELENTIERGVLLADGEWLAGEALSDELRPRASAPGAPVEPGGIGLKEYVRVHTARLERDLILTALEAEQGNVTRTARRLDISRKALQLKMKEYGLRDEAGE